MIGTCVSLHDMCFGTLELYVQEWKHMRKDAKDEFGIEGIRTVKYIM